MASNYNADEAHLVVTNGEENVSQGVPEVSVPDETAALDHPKAEVSVSSFVDDGVFDSAPVDSQKTSAALESDACETSTSKRGEKRERESDDTSDVPVKRHATPSGDWEAKVERVKCYFARYIKWRTSGAKTPCQPADKLNFLKLNQCSITNLKKIITDPAFYLRLANYSSTKVGESKSSGGVAPTPKTSQLNEAEEGTIKNYDERCAELWIDGEMDACDAYEKSKLQSSAQVKKTLTNGEQINMIWSLQSKVLANCLSMDDMICRVSEMMRSQSIGMMNELMRLQRSVVTSVNEFRGLHNDFKILVDAVSNMSEKLSVFEMAMRNPAI